MTWLPVNTHTVNERDAVLGLQQAVYQHHKAFLNACGSAVDAELLELCKARMAQTLHCREELARHNPKLLTDLESFSDSTAFTDLQRDALEFVDQFLLDPAMITGELLTSLEAEMSASGVIDFTTVISAFEASIRLSVLLDLEPAK